MSSCVSVASIGSSRIRCRECGMYFKEDEGITIVGWCFPCIPYVAPHDAVGAASYLSPYTPIDEQKLFSEKQLTRAQLAIYFLHEAMVGTKKSMQPAKSAESALRLFAENFPEYCGP